MINTLKINYTNHTIVMDRTFAKLAQDTIMKQKQFCTMLSLLIASKP